MEETMFEVNWHSVNDDFSHCTVTPITVIRKSILPGCTGISITAIDSSGHRFQGSPEDYFTTEEAAWKSIKADLKDSITDLEGQFTKLQEAIMSQKEYLKGLE